MEAFIYSKCQGTEYWNFGTRYLARIATFPLRTRNPGEDSTLDVLIPRFNSGAWQFIVSMEKGEEDCCKTILELFCMVDLVIVHEKCTVFVIRLIIMNQKSTSSKVKICAHLNLLQSSRS